MVQVHLGPRTPRPRSLAAGASSCAAPETRPVARTARGAVGGRLASLAARFGPCPGDPTDLTDLRDPRSGTAMAKASKKLSKKLDKLEKQADDLRKKAEKKGKQLQSNASDRLDDLQQDDKGGNKGKILLLLAAIVGGALAFKKKRDQELDEALWEEPRSI
ncbi:hypothetical protein FTX61_07400 [Nitriliruptoraceae bacterium ZYF776]|nr:hypothetical protein [Profundirhabdus halotolerans]